MAAVATLFERVLARDESCLAALGAAGFTLDEAGWLFTLPALHRFLGEQGLWPEHDYLAFRKALFAYPLNTRLRQCGGEVAIALNHGKVDQSHYLLRALASDD